MSNNDQYSIGKKISNVSNVIKEFVEITGSVPSNPLDRITSTMSPVSVNEPKGVWELRYDPKSSKIFFIGREIIIPSHSNQSDICKTLFKNDKSMRREWSWDEILGENGEDVDYKDKNKWRKVYNAAREINKRIVLKTGVIKPLLIVKKRTLSINPEYLL